MKLNLPGVTTDYSVRGANQKKPMSIRRIATHWPKAAIALGVLLTLAWIGFLAWMVVHEVLAVT
jgi:hypothetical protein